MRQVSGGRADKAQSAMVSTDQVFDVVRERQNAQLCDKLHALGRIVCIAGPDFIEYSLGYVQIKAILRGVPPLLSDLPMGGHNQVAAWANDEVARHSGFKVDGRHLKESCARLGSANVAVEPGMIVTGLLARSWRR
jgi:hypothetical protein